MKTNKLISILFMALLVSASGCIRCGGMRSEQPAPVTFYFVDTEGRDPFYASGKNFHIDSLRLTLENEPFNYLFAGKDETLDKLIFETYPVLYNKSRVRMLLHLNSLNTDTLDIAYTVRRGDCYTDYNYSAFYLNGKELQPNPENGYLPLPVF
jgi:hypothetical protein